MNSNLGEFFNMQFKELCSECEEWTEGTCMHCESPLCDDCDPDHCMNEYDEEEDQ